MYFNTKINNPLNRSAVEPITMGTTDAKIFVCKFFQISRFPPAPKKEEKEKKLKNTVDRVETGVFFFFFFFSPIDDERQKGRREARRGNKQGCATCTSNAVCNVPERKSARNDVNACRAVVNRIGRSKTNCPIGSRVSSAKGTRSCGSVCI